VHVLAYFVSDATPNLSALLDRQRALRVERALEIADILKQLGAPIDVDALVADATAPGGKGLARPQIAQALVRAGHAGSVAEAFEKYLAEEGPAYVPHRGASPSEVIGLIRAGGGITSLAHPGYRQRDEIIPDLVDAGLVAIEAFHSCHDTSMEVRYLQLAERYGLCVTGGSDYHGEGTRRAEFFGRTSLPSEYFHQLIQGRTVELVVGAGGSLSSLSRDQSMRRASM
jgi:predicted metal-dependent phosphoesterase TrpH